jgi:hypothetical protein
MGRKLKTKRNAKLIVDGVKDLWLEALHEEQAMWRRSNGTRGRGTKGLCIYTNKLPTKSSGCSACVLRNFWGRSCESGKSLYKKWNKSIITSEKNAIADQIYLDLTEIERILIYEE